MAGSSAFAGRKVLITGGLGFIGSALAIRLVELGAHVTLMDAMLPGHGANLFNIAPIRDSVTVTFSDVRDANIMGYLVKDQEFLFHLAGHVDHVTSLEDPYPDIDINVRGTATVMEACRKFNPDVRVIFTGTRGEYGEATSLPVDELAPTMPKLLQEISNLTAEKITHMYDRVHHVRSVMLRLTNIYGERGQMRHSRYGVANWFIRQAIDDQEIKVFGTGEIMREFLYIDDCVDALVMCALCPQAYGEILNVATGDPLNFVTLAKTLVEVAQTGSWSFAPFTPERAAQEPGDFYADISKIRRIVDWEPKTALHDGLSKSIEFYRLNREHYW